MTTTPTRPSRQDFYYVGPPTPDDVRAMWLARNLADAPPISPSQATVLTTLRMCAMRRHAR